MLFRSPSFLIKQKVYFDAKILPSIGLKKTKTPLVVPASEKEPQMHVLSTPEFFRIQLQLSAAPLTNKFGYTTKFSRKNARSKSGVKVHHHELMLPTAWLRDHNIHNYERNTFQRLHIDLRTPHTRWGSIIRDTSQKTVVTNIQQVDSKKRIVVFAVNSLAIEPTASTKREVILREEFHIPFSALLASAFGIANKKKVMTAAGRKRAAADSGAMTLEAVSKNDVMAISKGTTFQQLLAQSDLPHALNDRHATMRRVALSHATLAHDIQPHIQPAKKQHNKRKFNFVQWNPANSTACHRSVMRGLLRDGFSIVRDQRILSMPNHRDPPPPYRPQTAFQEEDPVFTHTDPIIRYRSAIVASIIKQIFGTIRNTHFGGMSVWGTVGAKIKPADYRIKMKTTQWSKSSASKLKGADVEIAHKDTAYLSTAIGLHTDSTYFLEPPKVQVFGPIHQTDDTIGGENQLCDGYAVAKRLRAEYPKYFNTLSRVPVPTYYAKEQKHFCGFRPVIRLSGDGEVEQLSFNQYDRAPLHLSAHLSGAQDMAEFYAAYETFGKMCKEMQFNIPGDVHTGQLLLYDNHRMLHAREGFSGPRIMCGAYVGLDDFVSAATQARLTEAAKK